jgi:transcriptional regulator with XRE-family HTH domain
MQRKRTSRAALSAEHVVLGRAIRELRSRRAYTQEELGFRSGIHRNYVGALERGEVNATFRTLLTVTGGLDVPLSILVRLYERRRGEVPS